MVRSRFLTGKNAARRSRGGVLLGPLDGLVEAAAVERFEEVVDRGDLERAQGVVVVCGDEHDRGRVSRGQRAHDVEAVAAGHLDVQQDELGALAAHEGDGLGDVCGLAGDGHVVPRVEERADLLAREALVVDDQDAEHGMAISTAKPLSFAP